MLKKELENLLKLAKVNLKWALESQVKRDLQILSEGNLFRGEGARAMPCRGLLEKIASNVRCVMNHLLQKLILVEPFRMVVGT